MTGNNAIDPWLLDRLVCPRDHESLSGGVNELRCARGHSYAVVDGIPIMLLDDVQQTFGASRSSLARGRGEAVDQRAPELHLESIEISEEEKRGVLELAVSHPPIDPVVAYLVAATNGLMYKHLIGHLTTYPIPEIDLPPGRGESLLDIGCSWGRWTLAAANKGYESVGIDPSLGAVMAARRVARQMGVTARFVVGDARYLPFRDGSIAHGFSYSVIQHFSRDDAGRAIGEIGRVLRAGGTARVQMPTKYGIRCLYHQVRRGMTDGSKFDVRYWRLSDLRRLFTDRIGPSEIEIDGYFGIGLQQSDAALMSPGRGLVLRASAAAKVAASRLTWLINVADSVYVCATKVA